MSFYNIYYIQWKLEHSINLFTKHTHYKLEYLFSSSPKPTATKIFSFVNNQSQPSLHEQKIMSNEKLIHIYDMIFISLNMEACTLDI